MAIFSAERSDPSNRFQFNATDLAKWFLGAVAVIYALLAGLHTVQDFDLGWQLATGRWVLQHRDIFSTDVFSYTAYGQPWIYPAFSGIVFYLVYLGGGYTLISWMGAIACAGNVCLLLRRNSVVTLALAIVAVPLIANRTQPRAEMFTTILFAAFLSLLWRHYRTGRSSLWLIPILMLGWVNLHLGFIAGLALCVAYVLLEVSDLPFPARRPAALGRLQQSWPWLASAGAATFLNPWGPFIYLALVRQERAQPLHTSWLVEWQSIHPSWASLRQAMDWRDPQSSFWWLIATVAISACIGLWRKQIGTVVLLIVSAYLAIQHVRGQALFACVAVVVGGTLIGELGRASENQSRRRSDVSHPTRRTTPILTACALLLSIAMTVLIGIRSADLISNRYYMRFTQLSLFGTGLSWWYPERAVEFLQREKLPANVFNTYSLGGYLTWRLFPAYRDYIDGRAIPFGPELFFRAYDLGTEPPDSRAWQQEADARGINTIIVPLSRYEGMTLFPQLHGFCRSASWRPVYMDEVAAVFVRRSVQAGLVDRLQIDCDEISFEPPSELRTTRTSRAKAELFNFWANAGGVLYSLERYGEALSDLDRAQSIFGDNANVHLLRALVLQQSGRPVEAEAEFRTSLRLEPSDEAWFDFGLFCMTQKRYEEAAEIFGKSAESSSRPHELWMMQGQAYVQMRQPQAALDALDKAVNSSPFREGGEALGASFNSLIAAGRAAAWYQLGDLSQAVSFQEEAVKLAPEDHQLWLGLADLYEVQGRTTKAAEARSRATGTGLKQ